MSDKTTDAETFVRQCGEAGERITDLLFSYPKHVAVCVLPGVLASTIKALGIPRDAAVAMLDSASKTSKAAPMQNETTAG